MCVLLLADSGRHGVSPPKLQPKPKGTAVAAQTDAVRHLTDLGLPVYCGAATGRDVALTFDDGPGPYTHFAIDALRRAHVRATFFLVGRNLPGREQLVRSELTVGELGDHTYTHPWLPSLDAATMAQELSRAKDAIALTGGAPVGLFRPPYEGRTPAIDAQAKALGMLQILWDVDSRDWAGADHNGIARNVIRGLRPGSIFLMHENRGQTIRALRKILPALRRKRLRAVTVSELLAHNPPSDAQVQAGTKGCPLIARAGRRAG
ncbi:MAG: peptidoglycan-N-acetylglucosamine deacetylase [Solirubrobacteraceae bacterium]|nr:peptidoglycan-N-acetylglucosamine deacetylase [Solirubrobacteraceae bacterium]